MSTIQVYDPPLCCSSGVCGPDVDPKLVQFAADLKQLQAQGVEVRRFNLAQNPAAFVENETVKTALTEKGEAALPLVFAGGKVVASGAYPEREALASALGLGGDGPGLFTPAVAELIAIGAAIAANCEPCLRYHVNEANKQGVTTGDIVRAIEMAAKVKDAPHRNIMRLATRLTQTEAAAVATSTDAGGQPAEIQGAAAKSACCSS